MSWGLGWKRSSDIFHLALIYGDTSDPIAEEDPSNPKTSVPDNPLGFRIDLDWISGDDEEQAVLRLQSQIMVALPPLQDRVIVRFEEDEEKVLTVDMKVVKRRELLRSITMSKPAGSGQQSDGIGVLMRLVRSSLEVVDVDETSSSFTSAAIGGGDHWKNVTVLSLCGCGLSVRYPLPSV